MWNEFNLTSLADLDWIRVFSVFPSQFLSTRVVIADSLHAGPVLSSSNDPTTIGTATLRTGSLLRSVDPLTQEQVENSLAVSLRRIV